MSVYMNTLTITSSAITNIELLRATIHITAGQQLESATVSHSDGVWSLNIDCGRSGSADVAQSYLDQIGGNYHMLVQPNFCPSVQQSHRVALLWPGRRLRHELLVDRRADDPQLQPYKSPMAYLAVSNSTLYQVTFVSSAVNQLAIA